MTERHLVKSMYEETKSADGPVRENIYLSAIGKCHEIIDRISLKVNVIQNQTEKANLKDGTPSRTQLERDLQNLVTHLTELENSIVV